MKSFYFACTLGIVLLSGCSIEKQQTQSASTNVSLQNVDIAASPSIRLPTSSKNWMGTYQAVIPCEHCESILIELTLHQDFSYYLSEKYLDDNNKHQPLDSVGLYSQDKTSPSILYLDGAADHRKIKIEKDYIILDADILSSSTPHTFKLIKTS